MCANEYNLMKLTETDPVDLPTVAMVRDKNHYQWDTVHGFGDKPHSKLATLRTALDMVWAAVCATGEGTILFPKI